MERPAIEQADAVIAVSKETRNDVLRLFDVAPEKVHVIYNGIDLEQYRKDPSVDALVQRGVDPEAMACETAVLASAVGGIPEVVVPGETGLLIDLELKPNTFDPVDPDQF